jgi:hypothetical protein
MISSLSALASTAAATEVGHGRNFGLGFQVGDPSAIIGKLFVGNGNAIDFGVGFWGYGSSWCYDRVDHRYRCYGSGYRSLSLHADYLWQDGLIRGPNAGLDWHIGVGGRVFFARDNGPYDNDDVWLAARMPLGLDLTFARANFIEVFFEIAPTLFLVPFQDFDVDAALGVRFYF